eukprot:g33068.t1
MSLSRNAAVGHRENAAAVGHQVFGAVGKRHQAVGADIHCEFEAGAADFVHRAFQVFNRCERHRVHDEVERAEGFLRGGEHGVEMLVVLHVAGHHEFGADWFDQLAEFLLGFSPFEILIGKMGKPHFGPFGGQLLSDRPGDRAVVRDAEHEPFFSGKHSHNTPWISLDSSERPGASPPICVRSGANDSDSAASDQFLILTLSTVSRVIPAAPRVRRLPVKAFSARITVLTTFDRYLLKRYLHAFVILFISMYGLYVVIDGFTNVDGFQQGRDSANDVMTTMAYYYFYQAFQFFDMVASILSVVAVMVVFALLQRNSEFHPVLAAGIPTRRLLYPVMFGTMLVNGVVLANQEMAIPQVARFLQAPKSKKAVGYPVEPLYDRKSRIHIDGKSLHMTERVMNEAEFLLPVPELSVELTTLTATTAEYLEASERRPSGWILRNVKPGYEGIQLTETGRKYVRRTSNPNDVFVVSDVSFDQLNNRAKNFRFLSTPQLIRRIKNPSTGLTSIRGQTLFFHNRLVRPLLNVIAVIVIVPLILRRESRGLVTNLAVGAVVMGVLYGVSLLFGYLGQVNVMRPDLAAWSTVIFTGSFGVWIFGIAQTNPAFGCFLRQPHHARLSFRVGAGEDDVEAAVAIEVADVHAFFRTGTWGKGDVTRFPAGQSDRFFRWARFRQPHHARFAFRVFTTENQIEPPVFVDVEHVDRFRGAGFLRQRDRPAAEAGRFRGAARQQQNSGPFDGDGVVGSFVAVEVGCHHKHDFLIGAADGVFAPRFFLRVARTGVFQPAAAAVLSLTVADDDIEVAVAVDIFGEQRHDPAGFVDRVPFPGGEVAGILG